MDARQLNYFLAVVDHGGVNRAAKELYVAQPSLSQSIRSLERDLGTALFHRVGRRLVLTEAGRALVEPARQVVRGMEFARASVDSVAGLTTGRVEIAAMPSQTIAPLSGWIGRFTRRHPEVLVSVRAAFTAREVVQMVRSGVTELGLLGSSDPASAPEVTITPTGTQRFVLVAAPDGPFPPGRPIRREQLAGQRLIVGQEGTGMRRLVDDIIGAGVPSRIAVESEHREAILPLVLDGVGMAVVTDAWTPLARQAGALVLDLEPPAHLHIALVNRRGPLTPAARAFFDLATCRNRPGL
jgi:DNA-binding transcriptional LysR family regulator